MLTQKQKEVPYISVFKTQSGEEFIGKVTEETVMNWTVMNPLCMVATEKGMQFAPYMMMVDPSKGIKIPKPMATGEPIPKLEEQYLEVIDPKLIARVAPGTKL